MPSVVQIHLLRTAQKCAYMASFIGVRTAQYSYAFTVAIQALDGLVILLNEPSSATAKAVIQHFGGVYPLVFRVVTCEYLCFRHDVILDARPDVPIEGTSRCGTS